MNNRRFVETSIIITIALAGLGILCESRVANYRDIVYSTQEQIYSDTQSAPCRDKDRLGAAVALLKRYGATDGDIEVRDKHHVKNVIVTLKGTGSEYLVVGAHYDKADVGCGAVDNWSGIVLLSHIYKTLRQMRPTRTILFVAFGAEEDGLRGSKALVGDIAKENRPSYCAMVNLDSFGLSRPQVLENTTTPKLQNFAAEVAKRCKVPIATASLEGVADADSSSFKAAGIPAITLHALSNDWTRILHSPQDKPAQILPASMYLAYILSLNLVAELDACDCAKFR